MPPNAAPRRIVIVGAGQAGVRAALTLRAEGFDGALMLIGAEPEPPYERPPLSKAFLTRDVDEAMIAIGPPTALGDAQVMFRQGIAALAIDRRERRVATSCGIFSYDRVLLATGSTARALPRTAPSDRILTLRTVADARRLRAGLETAGSLLIIGGGLIGLEVAATARTMGVAVTVIEAAPRLLGRVLPSGLSAVVRQAHEATGTALVLNAAVDSLTGNTDVHCRLADGREYRADICLVAVGSIADTRLAQGAGLTVGRGVQVDRQLRTADSAIFAAGDCAEILAGGRSHKFEDYASAESQARVAARNMLGRNVECDLCGSFWSDQGALALRGAGVSPDDARHVERSYDDGEVVFALAQDNCLLGAFSLGSARGGQDVRIAQLLIEQGPAVLAPDLLADPGTRLRQLLKRA